MVPLHRSALRQLHAERQALNEGQPDPALDEPAPIQALEGPSFTPAIKLLATLLVLGLLVGAVQTWQAGTWLQWSAAARGLVALLMLTLLAAYAGMLGSRTSFDGRCIRQTGLWPKQVELAQITQLKLIHVPGFAWLVAPRLMVRSGGLGMTTFHVADERVLAALRRLAYG